MKTGIRIDVIPVKTGNVIPVKTGNVIPVKTGNVIPVKTGIQPARTRVPLSGPPSPRGRRRSALRAAGFTLIEVLVVVAISGILLAVAAVNLFPSDEQVARREAGAVALAIERARDTAWFGGLPTAVSFEEGRVRQWRLAGNAWEPRGKGDTAVEGVRILALHVDGQALDARERLVFLPDGLGTPFRVALDARGLQWAVEGDASGSVRLVPR